MNCRKLVVAGLDVLCSVALALLVTQGIAFAYFDGKITDPCPRRMADPTILNKNHIRGIAWSELVCNQVKDWYEYDDGDPIVTAWKLPCGRTQKINKVTETDEFVWYVETGGMSQRAGELAVKFPVEWAEITAKLGYTRQWTWGDHNEHNKAEAIEIPGWTLPADLDKAVQPHKGQKVRVIHTYGLQHHYKSFIVRAKRCRMCLDCKTVFGTEIVDLVSSSKIQQDKGKPTRVNQVEPDHHGVMSSHTPWYADQNPLDPIH